MKSTQSTNEEGVQKLTKAQVFLQEWKRRRKEDEEKFLQTLKDPQHIQEMEKLRGKIVKNGKIVSAS